MRLFVPFTVAVAAYSLSPYHVVHGFSFAPTPTSLRVQSIASRSQQLNRLSMSMGPAPGLSIGHTVGLNYVKPADSEQPAVAASTTSSPNTPGNYDSVIVGGGPAGLLSAIMMAQQLPNLNGSNSGRIVVYDRLPPPPPPDNLVYSTDISKYYLLGLGHRGQRALKHFGAWKDVEAASVAVLGRRDWAPGKSNEEDSNIKMANKTVTSRVLARDKLVGVLKQVIERDYSDVIELKYGYQVDPISFGNEGDDEVEGGENGLPVVLDVSQCIPLSTSASSDEAEECSIENADATPTIISTNFLIGSDGAARTIANAMEANDIKHQSKMNSNPLKRLFGKRNRFKVKRYEDDNPRVYKSIPIKFPSHWPHDLNYSARSRESRITFEALPSDANGNYCALALMKPDDELAAANCDPKVLREYFDAEFPQFSKLLDDGVMSDVATKGASALPSFRYAGPRLHEGGRTVILGDAVHTVKPYFGLGANTALEDVMILSEILSNTPDLSNNLHKAVSSFTKQRAADSKALVTISRGIDRPGKLGTMRFVVPLILDSMFNKIAPKFFAPNIFGMFQKEGMGFKQIQQRKRLDRVMQSTIIVCVLSSAGVGINCLVKSLARLMGVKDTFVGGALAVLVGVAGFLKKKVSSTS